MRISLQPDGKGKLSHFFNTNIGCRWSAEDEKILKKKPTLDFFISWYTYVGYTIQPEDFIDETREKVKKFAGYIIQNERCHVKGEDGHIIIFNDDGRIEVHRTFENSIPQEVILPSPTEAINEVIKEALKYI